MKSKALNKFKALHPQEHKELETILANSEKVRTPGVFFRPQTEEINCEISNMIQNQRLCQANAEDENWLHKSGRSFLTNSKTVNWDDNISLIITVSPVDVCTPLS